MLYSGSPSPKTAKACWLVYEAVGEVPLVSRLCACSAERELIRVIEAAILDDNEEEHLRCLRAQQRIDSMRDPEAKALAQDEECQRQLKRRVDSLGC